MWNQLMISYFKGTIVKNHYNLILKSLWMWTDLSIIILNLVISIACGITVAVYYYQALIFVIIIVIVCGYKGYNNHLN